MFKLLRYFSLTSAVAILTVTVALVVLYRHNAVNDLVENAENQSVALARSFANTIWPRFSDYVTSHELWKEGAIPMGFLTTESAYTRLLAALLNCETEEEVIHLMEECR